MTNLADIERPDRNGRTVLSELAELFHREPEAETLLRKAGAELGLIRGFGQQAPLDWWREICRDIAAGKFRNVTIDVLLRAAADVYPGNNLLSQWLDPASKPDHRNLPKGGSIDLTVPDNVSMADLLALVEKVTPLALQGIDVRIALGREGSNTLSVWMENAAPADIELYRQAVQRAAAERNIPIVVSVPYTFRDYMMDPLRAEGPDGQRFELGGVPASTKVGEIARGIMNEYADDVWPQNRQGGRQTAVVDLVKQQGGAARLPPEQTLHEAGVRPNDTLRVAPDRTAGAIDPLMREEALARVRVQVLDHARANPGFEVEANSLVAPTEYLFHFRVPGFAPPPSEDADPPRIDRHSVLVELPPDFPIKAPIAWWQTDIFHPNVDAKSGLVCLGALQQHYKPGLDFGELCTMLTEMAAYRTYTLEEGYNRAAAKWALSPRGQHAIDAAGGTSLARRLMPEDAPTHRFGIRKVDR